MIMGPYNRVLINLKAKKLWMKKENHRIVIISLGLTQKIFLKYKINNKILELEKMKNQILLNINYNKVKFKLIYNKNLK